MTDAVRARRGLTIYFLLLAAGSALIQWRIITGGGSLGDHGGLIMLLMWTPGLASLVTRAVLREGIGDVSFRWGGRKGTRALLFAWLFPVVVGAVAYGIAWATGLAGFAPPPVAGFPRAEGPLARLAVGMLMALTAGQVVSAIFAAGEEIGWRGYMLTRLITAGVPFPLVTSGLIWGGWHLPLILSGMYATGPNRIGSALMFLVSIAAAGVLIGWLRLYSGSVWPAVLAHASWNVVIQDVFDRATTGSEPGGRAAIWIGESGLLVVGVLLLAAILVGRRALPTLVTGPGGRPAAGSIGIA
jgi:membrane protease YdiL (CAAX protease family)